MTVSADFVPRVLESRAKSIDEAIFKGMREMGVSIDEVTIETVQEGSKGILGIGAKPYIVRLTEKDPRAELKEMQENHARAERERLKNANARTESKPREQRRTPNLDSPPAKPFLPKEDNPPVAAVANEAMKPDIPAEPPRSTRPAPVPASQRAQEPRPNNRRPNPQTRDGQRGRGGSRGRNDRSDGVPVSNVAQQVTYTPFIPGESECDGAAFLQGLLKHMGVEAKIGFYQGDGLIKYRIDSETMGILIGRRGETLDAMQYLTSLVVNRGQENYRRVTLDTENYRSKREETLMRLARKIAAQVRTSGQPVPLEPMNPYERRVLHAALQRNPYVETYSEGDEPNRHVVVAPKKR